MTNILITVTDDEAKKINAGLQTQFRSPVADVRLFSQEYDKEWYPHVLPPNKVSHRWAWFEGPPHGPSCYHLAECPFGQVGDLLTTTNLAENFSLLILRVKVERVQEINEQDALANGGWTYAKCPYHKAPEMSFQYYWKDTYGVDSWERNDWVWVITFKQNRND